MKNMFTSNAFRHLRIIGLILGCAIGVIPVPIQASVNPLATAVLQYFQAKNLSTTGITFPYSAVKGSCTAKEACKYDWYIQPYSQGDSAGTAIIAVSKSKVQTYTVLSAGGGEITSISGFEALGISASAANQLYKQL